MMVVARSVVPGRRGDIQNNTMNGRRGSTRSDPDPREMELRSFLTMGSRKGVPFLSVIYVVVAVVVGSSTFECQRGRRRAQLCSLSTDTCSPDMQILQQFGRSRIVGVEYRNFHYYDNNNINNNGSILSGVWPKHGHIEGHLLWGLGSIC